MSFWKSRQSKHAPADPAPIEPAPPPRENYGLFPLTPEDPSLQYTVDIVAVHGLGGDWENTWTADNGKLWLRDFLPDQLHQVKCEPRIFSYGYDASTVFSKSVADIQDAATGFLNSLALERVSKIEECRPLIVIAHNLGGIVIKKVSLLDFLDLGKLYKSFTTRTTSLDVFDAVHIIHGVDGVDESVKVMTNCISQHTRVILVK